MSRLRDTIRFMSTGSLQLPSPLLQAVADRSGRIALVVGAGCSLEWPTDLKLADAYAEEVHQQLVLDHVLDPGDCAKPDDLSIVAASVWEKRRSQADVVTRLPLPKFRNAKANAGYLAAAALLRERAVCALLTLNFDLAMSHALTELSADEVAVIAGPQQTRDLGSHIVVYLHRNVNESDAEKWVLRVDALASEWQGEWQEALSQRIMSSPVVVFAGLGSPAAVLTETVTRIRACLDPSQHVMYVVDPAGLSRFSDALQLAPDAQVRLGWCDFMTQLADRLAAELQLGLEGACKEICERHGWSEELEDVRALCDTVFASGLVASGMVRARWLLARESYVPDDERGRALVADLLLGIGLARRSGQATVSIRRDGIVQFHKDERVAASCMPASGRGFLRWSAIEAETSASIKKFASHERPDAVLLAGVQGSVPADLTADVAPPDDVIFGTPDDDIKLGHAPVRYVTVDELRSDPQAASRLVS